MTIKDLEERLEILESFDDPLFEKVKILYSQAIEQIQLIKSIIEFTPDPIGIDPNIQLVKYVQQKCTEHLSKIGEA